MKIVHVACGAVAALLYARLRGRKRLQSLSDGKAPVVTCGQRSGRRPEHGQRLEVSGVESGMLEFAVKVRGGYKAVVLSELRGDITEAAIRAAAAAVQRWQPFLRTKLIVAASGEYVFEVDDALELPVKVWKVDDAANVEEAYLRVWRSIEKVRGELNATFWPMIPTL